MSDTYKIIIRKANQESGELGAASPTYANTIVICDWLMQTPPDISTALDIRDQLKQLGWAVATIGVEQNGFHNLIPLYVWNISIVAKKNTEAERKKIESAMLNFFQWKSRYFLAADTVMRKSTYNDFKTQPAAKKEVAKQPAAKNQQPETPANPPKPDAPEKEKSLFEKLADEFKVTKETVIAGTVLLAVLVFKD